MEAAELESGENQPAPRNVVPLVFAICVPLWLRDGGPITGDIGIAPIKLPKNRSNSSAAEQLAKYAIKRLGKPDVLHFGKLIG